jgi:dTMP kinase
MTGRYIALEGVEGSGKSTLAGLLEQRLSEQGFDVVVVREPGGTDLGEEVRRLVLHSGDVAPWAEAALFAAGRAQLAVEVIAPAIAAGGWVISDRSYYSSLAYQGGARGLGIETVRRLNETVLAGVVPDVVFLLDLDPEVGFARELERDRMAQGGLAFQEAVASAYADIAASDPRVVSVDATLAPERLASVVLDRLGRLL